MVRTLINHPMNDIIQSTITNMRISQSTTPRPPSITDHSPGTRSGGGESLASPSSGHSAGMKATSPASFSSHVGSRCSRGQSISKHRPFRRRSERREKDEQEEDEEEEDEEEEDEEEEDEEEEEEEEDEDEKKK